MNQFDVVQGFLEPGEPGSPPPDQLTAAFLEATTAFGFRHFACCSQVQMLHLPPEAGMFHIYPRGWLRTYSEPTLSEKDLKAREIHPLRSCWDRSSVRIPTRRPSSRRHQSRLALPGYRVTLF